MTLSRADVVQAAARIAGQVIRTPVVRCAALDERAGAELWLKAENLQHIGAFKARGAFNSIAQLPDHVRAAGVITYSSGNHAQAVALAAKHYGISADIYMPTDAPPIKVERVRSLGAAVHLVGTTSTERHRAAQARHAESRATIIEPFDHPHTIAGQGTATLELLEDAERAGTPLDALIIPIGGGGLIAGACLVADPTLAVYGVEPVGCDSMRRSLAAGHVVAVEPGPTLADGLKPTRVGELTFAIARDRLNGCETVTDAELADAVRHLAFGAKLVVEPSGAAGLALALRGPLPGRPGRIGIVLSGGNIAPDTLAALLVGSASTLVA